MEILYRKNADRDPINLYEKGYLTKYMENDIYFVKFCDSSLSKLEEEGIFKYIPKYERCSLYSADIEKLKEKIIDNKFAEIIYKAYLNNDLWEQCKEY